MLPHSLINHHQTRTRNLKVNPSLQDIYTVQDRRSRLLTFIPVCTLRTPPHSPHVRGNINSHAPFRLYHTPDYQPKIKQYNSTGKEFYSFLPFLSVCVFCQYRSGGQETFSSNPRSIPGISYRRTRHPVYLKQERPLQSQVGVRIQKKVFETCRVLGRYSLGLGTLTDSHVVMLDT